MGNHTVCWKNEQTKPTKPVDLFKPFKPLNLDTPDPYLVVLLPGGHLCLHAEGVLPATEKRGSRIRTTPGFCRLCVRLCICCLHKVKFLYIVLYSVHVYFVQYVSENQSILHILIEPYSTGHYIKSLRLHIIHGFSIPRPPRFSRCVHLLGRPLRLKITGTMCSKEAEPRMMRQKLRRQTVSYSERFLIPCYYKSKVRNHVAVFLLCYGMSCYVMLCCILYYCLVMYCSILYCIV